MKIKTVWCWYCKKEISVNDETCPHCNMPLTDAKKVIQCRKCGKFIVKSVDACPNCGEVLEKTKHKPRRKRRISPLVFIIPLAVLLIGAIAFFAVRGILAHRAAKAAEPDEPAYCAENEHVWQEADCTNPKTCTICGKTEGEPLGHLYRDNVCVICGDHEKPYSFADSACERDGSYLVFSGSIKNWGTEPVSGIPLKIELFDEEQKLVATEMTATPEGEEAPPMGSIRWSYRCSDSFPRWKYWRVSVPLIAPPSEAEG